MPQTCRFCAAPLSHVVVDLGMSPLCESFLRPEQLDGWSPSTRCAPMVCDRCFLVAAARVRRAGGDLHRVRLLLVVLDSWLEHARAVRRARCDAARPGPRRASSSSSAATTATCCSTSSTRGIPVLGIEPAANVAAVAEAAGRPDPRPVLRPRARAGARRDRPAGRPHRRQQRRWPRSRTSTTSWPAWRCCSRPTGLVTIEFPHLLRLIEDNQFDTIYHEHFSYFSLATLDRILAAHGLDGRRRRRAADARRVAARPRPPRRRPRPSRPRSTRCSRASGEAGLEDRRDVRRRSARGSSALKRAVLAFLIEARRAGQTVAGYGAPGKANTLLNYCGIRTDLLPYTVDRNPYKHGRFTPGHAHPDPRARAARRGRARTIVWILPWNLRDEIAAQLGLRRDVGRPALRGHPGAAPSSRRRSVESRRRPRMKVVLFCGGHGLRLRELHRDHPQADGRRSATAPILWHVMRYYAHFGHKDFMLCLGYRADVIKDYFLHYDEALSNDFVLSDGGALGRAAAARDIEDWRITFVDTGLQANDRRAAAAVRRHLAGRGDLPGQLRRRPDRRAAGRARRGLPRPRQGRRVPGRPPALHVPRRRQRGRRRGHGDPARRRVRPLDQRRLLHLPADDLRLHRARRRARRASRSSG